MKEGAKGKRKKQEKGKNRYRKVRSRKQRGRYNIVYSTIKKEKRKKEEIGM
jgi:hypothetical protein